MLTIKSAPRIGQIYWCDFSKDAIKPEIHAEHPAVIVSKKNEIRGIVTILPCTTSDNSNNRNAVEIPAPFRADAKTWVLCNHITTVSTARLRVGNKGIPRISRNLLETIKTKVFANLLD